MADTPGVAASAARQEPSQQSARATAAEAVRVRRRADGARRALHVAVRIAFPSLCCDGVQQLTIRGPLRYVQYGAACATDDFL
jgi:hypothetical protein